MKLKTTSKEAPNDIFTKIDTFRMEDVSDEASLAKLRRRKTVTINGIERFRINYSGRYGKKGLGYYGFHEPNGICIADDNWLVVADTNKSLLVVFDSSGNIIKRVGGLTYPHKVAICPLTRNIVVTERSPNNQVKIFQPDWKLIRTFGCDVIKHPRGLAVDSVGNIFVLESMNMRIIIFDLFGNLLHIFEDKASFPNDIAIYDNREIFICDNGANLILVYNYHGERVDSIGEGAIEHPVGVKISMSGLIVVGDNHNSFKITVFDRDGKVVCGFESIPKLSSCLDIALSVNDILYVSSRDNNIYVYDLRAPWQNWSRKNYQPLSLDKKSRHSSLPSSTTENQSFLQLSNSAPSQCINSCSVGSNFNKHIITNEVLTNSGIPNMNFYQWSDKFPSAISLDNIKDQIHTQSDAWPISLRSDCSAIESKLAKCLQNGLSLGNEAHITQPRDKNISFKLNRGLNLDNDSNLLDECNHLNKFSLHFVQQNPERVPLSDALDWSAYSKALRNPWLDK